MCNADPRPTARWREFLSLMLLLSLIGLSASPLWGQGAAQDVGVGTDRFFTTSDGVKLHYIEAGKGRPMVLIPGGTMVASLAWAAQIREFSRDYRTIALDHRGRGLSEDGLRGEGYDFPRIAEDIHELIKHLKLSDVVLVGYSMGVKMVLAYADRFGTDRLSKMALVDGIVWNSTIDRCAGWVEGLKEMVSDRRAWYTRAMDNLFRQPGHEEVQKRLVETYVRTTPTNVAIWMGLVSFCSPAADQRAALTKLDRASIPLLYVYSTMPEDDRDTVKARVPSVRVEFIDGAGHGLPIEASDRFNRTLRDFLNAPRASSRRDKPRSEP